MKTTQTPNASMERPSSLTGFRSRYHWAARISASQHPTSAEPSLPTEQIKRFPDYLNEAWKFPPDDWLVVLQRSKPRASQWAARQGMVRTRQTLACLFWAIGQASHSMLREAGSPHPGWSCLGYWVPPSCPCIADLKLGKNYHAETIAFIMWNRCYHRCLSALIFLIILYSPCLTNQLRKYSL